MSSDPREIGPAPPPGIRDRLLVLVAVGGSVLLVDQLTKWWALNELGPWREIDVVWTLRFKLAFNTGMAFSQGAGSGAIIGLVVTAIVVALVVAAFRVRSKVQLVLLAVVIGGALGNLVDRATRVGETNPYTGEVAEGFLSGAVVDFVDLQWWPVFNVADAAVVVGGIALALVSARAPAEESVGEAEAGEPDGDAAELPGRSAGAGEPAGEPADGRPEDPTA